MKKILLVAVVGLLVSGCNEHRAKSEREKHRREFNQELVDELAKMAETDQIAAYIPQGEYKKMNQEEWSAFKDSVFRTHQERLVEIFKRYGYPGFDLVGKEGSKNFWLMVQHSDHDPEFQQKVLEKMNVEVKKGNADPEKYGYLIDRVNLNTGKAQIYGTQVTYNTEICQAYPKRLIDSANVNNRRRSIGLPPIEVYLNQMTKMHFEMNKEMYINSGIKKPALYNIP